MSILRPLLSLLPTCILSFQGPTCLISSEVSTPHSPAQSLGTGCCMLWGFSTSTLFYLSTHLLHPCPVYTWRQSPALPSYLDFYLHSPSLEPVLRLVVHLQVEEQNKTEWRQHSHSFQEAAAEKFRCSRMVTFNPPFY